MGCSINPDSALDRSSMTAVQRAGVTAKDRQCLRGMATSPSYDLTCPPAEFSDHADVIAFVREVIPWSNELDLPKSEELYI